MVDLYLLSENHQSRQQRKREAAAAAAAAAPTAQRKPSYQSPVTAGDSGLSERLFSKLAGLMETPPEWPATEGK